MRTDKATQEDFEPIIAFYDDVMERTPEIATYARWSKGKHPTAEGIRAEDIIHTGVWYMQYDFVDICHLLWFGF